MYQHRFYLLTKGRDVKIVSSQVVRSIESLRNPMRKTIKAKRI